MHQLGLVIEKLLVADDEVRRAQRRHAVRQAARARRWWTRSGPVSSVLAERERASDSRPRTPTYGRVRTRVEQRAQTLGG